MPAIRRRFFLVSQPGLFVPEYRQGRYTHAGPWLVREFGKRGRTYCHGDGGDFRECGLQGAEGIGEGFWQLYTQPEAAWTAEVMYPAG